MDWLATLRRSGGLHALARKVGASPADAMAAAGGLLPQLLEAMRQFVACAGGGQVGIKALVDLLAGLGDGNLAAEVMGPGPLHIEPGERLLSLISYDADPWEGQDNSFHAAGQDAELAQRLTPGLAMLVGGYLSAQALAGAADGANGLAHLRDLLEPAGEGPGGGSSRWDEVS